MTLHFIKTQVKNYAETINHAFFTAYIRAIKVLVITIEEVAIGCMVATDSRCIVRLPIYRFSSVHCSNQTYKFSCQDELRFLCVKLSTHLILHVGKITML